MTRNTAFGSAVALPARWLARASHALFEPSPLITEVTERRRARLLAKLQLAHVALLLFPVGFIGRVEKGRAGELLPLVLLAAAGGVLLCYALSRTRHVRVAVWAHVAIALAFPPIGLALTTPTDGFAPLMSAVLLFPPVLLVNALVSARAALATGLLALVPLLMTHQLFGNAYWVELLRAGASIHLTYTALTVIFGVYRDRTEADRVAELRARNHELEELRRTLDDQVETRTRELSDRNAAMRLVLDNVAQGIFTVTRSGAMQAEHSAALSKWFGPVEVGEPFFRYLGRASAHFDSQGEFAWEQVLEDTLPLEVTLSQLPASLQAGSRSFRVSYELIDADHAGRTLIVVSDVTAEVERELAELENKETFTVFERVLDDRRGFLDFMREGSGLMARACDPGGERSDTLRALHTLKGNSLLFGIQSVARLCHGLETLMAGGNPMDEEQLEALSKRWHRLEGDMAKLLGRHDNLVELSREQHVALQRAARACNSKEDLVRLIDGLAFEPLDRRLSHFVDHAQRLADRLGKPVQVDMDHGSVHLDERPWSLLWAALVHAVRNALDHGIEPAAERRAAGKPEIGRLTFRARREDGNILIELEDDGRGLDWPAIGRKCELMKLPHLSRADLLEGLFAEGMSTAEQVTDISGRGIGMSALRQAVRALGGEIFVESERGRGTLLRMVFPPDASAASATFARVSPVELRADSDALHHDAQALGARIDS